MQPDLVVGDNQQRIKSVAGNPLAIAYLSIGSVEYEAKQGVAIESRRSGPMSLTSSCPSGRPSPKRSWTLTLLGCTCLLGLTAAWDDWDFERIIRNAERR